MHDAVAAQNSPSLGVELPAPPGRTVLFALAALLSSLGLTAWLEIAGHESFRGYLHAETMTIAADRDARIRQVLVNEGDVVQPGQTLMVLADDGLEATLTAARRELAALEAELQQAQAKAEVELTWRLQSLEAEIFETRLKSAGYLKEQFSRRLEGLAWHDFLTKDAHGGIVASSASDEQLVHLFAERERLPEESRIRLMLEQEAARNAAEVYAAQVKLCDSRLADLERLREQLPAKIRRAVGVDIAEARLAFATEELQQLESQRNELRLATPTYGTVGVFRKPAGALVAAGEPLVELLDEDRRFLVMQLPSRKLGRFSPGSEVTLRFPDGQKCKGKVLRIPPQTAAQPEARTAVAQADDALIPLRIEPVGKLWPQVPVGSAVEIELMH